jgi:hypothetical protein
MFFQKRKKCEKTVNDLIQEYCSSHEQNLRFKISGVDQKFTLKGLPISTIVVNDKLNVMYEYIDKLVDFVFQSLEEDFPGLPLNTCSKFLINIVEQEYKKLPDAAKIWLMQACLAQPQAIEQYRKAVLERLEQTKRDIESRC